MYYFYYVLSRLVSFESGYCEESICGTFLHISLFLSAARKFFKNTGVFFFEKKKKKRYF